MQVDLIRRVRSQVEDGKNSITVDQKLIDEGAKVVYLPDSTELRSTSAYSECKFFGISSQNATLTHVSPSKEVGAEANRGSQHKLFVRDRNKWFPFIPLRGPATRTTRLSSPHPGSNQVTGGQASQEDQSTECCSHVDPHVPSSPTSDGATDQRQKDQTWFGERRVISSSDLDQFKTAVSSNSPAGKPLPLELLAGATTKANVPPTVEGDTPTEKGKEGVEEEAVAEKKLPEDSNAEEESGVPQLQLEVQEHFCSEDRDQIVSAIERQLPATLLRLSTLQVFKAELLTTRGLRDLMQQVVNFGLEDDESGGGKGGKVNRTAESILVMPGTWEPRADAPEDLIKMRDSEAAVMLEMLKKYVPARHAPEIGGYLFEYFYGREGNMEASTLQHIVRHCLHDFWIDWAAGALGIPSREMLQVDRREVAQRSSAVIHQEERNNREQAELEPFEDWEDSDDDDLADLF